jgi:hypothetical protein
MLMSADRNMVSCEGAMAKTKEWCPYDGGMMLEVAVLARFGWEAAPEIDYIIAREQWN